MQFGSIQLRNSLLRVLRIGHFDEGEAAGLTRIPVRDDFDLFDIAELGKSREQFLLRGLEAEIADKNLAHGVLVVTFKLSRMRFRIRLGQQTDVGVGRKDRSGIEVERLRDGCSFRHSSERSPRFVRLQQRMQCQYT